MKLAAKIGVILVGVLVLAILSSVAMILSDRQLRALMEDMVVQNLASVRAAEELEIALLEQRGYIAFYILDGGNRDWLDELSRREPDFAHWLDRARQTANSDEERRLITEITEVYEHYDAIRGDVVALFDSGRTEEARTVLLRDMTASYDQVYALAEEFIAANERFISSRLAAGRARIERNTRTVAAYVGLTAVLSLGLFWLFFHGIAAPLRRLAQDARAFAGDDPRAAEPASFHDELRTVGFYLRRLMSDVSETRSDLERSRDRLQHAEKLASVGKLAASVAHEIRNPLTSLKMRLFSLRRELEGESRCEDDLRVVSEEISRLESVIRNFLEFARPPDLRLQPHPVTALLDKTLELCGHRFVEKDIRVTRSHSDALPLVQVDAEQVKQVFINLLLNAAEAVPEGGEVRIGAGQGLTAEGGAMVVVRFADSGPGIQETDRGRIFEPFFSTKETGTGLGLCIAASIMAHHGGRLELESAGPSGTTFAVWLPTA